jgi:hydrogenase nickel incorporation protein HypB
LGADHPRAPFLSGGARRLTLEQSVLAKNDRIAAENRAWFERHHVRVLNLISSPGSGKTLLLEKTIQKLPKDFKMVILTGDQAHDFDANRLKSAGADALQINTVSCHLDASTIQRELDRFVRPEHDLLIIENVGNLVCPAAFDLGETMKVALLSSTEGEDKPSKYPLLFHEAGLVVLTKMDLVPHLDWSLKLCEEHIRRVNAFSPILRLSARTGEGMEAWLGFLRATRVEKSA